MVLQQVTRGAGSECRIDDSPVVMQGAHDHLEVRNGSESTASGLDAAHPGHLDIDEKDIWVELVNETEHRLAVRSFAHQLHRSLVGEQGSHVLTKPQVVICQYNVCDVSPPDASAASNVLHGGAIRGMDGQVGS